MSKVIFKVSFKHPNLKDTVSKNVSHVNYISTRSGVDKTLTESDLKKELEKGVSNDEDYLKYIDERPRSHGLFGENGLEEPKEVQEEISQVSSYVWRGIISIKEEDAKKLGYINKDKWQDMLRKKIPDMANEMNISITNLRWVAAVHMEKGHPHAHVMFWEKEPKRTLGIVNKKTLDNIRKTFTDEIFYDERFQLLNEKNLMRDLIRDLADDDISKTTKLLKEINEEGKELKTFLDEMNSNEVGIMPKIYREDELILAEKIKNLADMMPGKGRANLKFMPDDVKKEVREIADYLLSKEEFQASLHKNLNAVKELTALYTGKEEDINKAIDNAYNDIRDRICQVVLKGAKESQKKNLFYVDDELSNKAIDFIKGINSKINIIPEQSKVINEISSYLLKTGHNHEETLKIILDFKEKENLNLSDELIKGKLNEINFDNSNNIDNLLSTKKVDYYLQSLKLSGYEEEKAFDILNTSIKNDIKELSDNIKDLEYKGILIKEEDCYKLTNDGINEYLKIKNLDRAEKNILGSLSDKELSYDELLQNKDIFDSLYDKDPKEFKLGKFDAKVRNLFGDDNKLTFNDLEKQIYEKYSDDVELEKADKEIEIYKARINKLVLNGFVKFDKENDIYSFTNETNNYYEYSEKKEEFVYKKDAAQKLGIYNFEFTRYDANVTLKYIDAAKDNILSKDDLKQLLFKEIDNKAAKGYYEKFTELLDNNRAAKYIKVLDNGDIISTDEGKELSKSFNSINKIYFKVNGELTESKLKEVCNDAEYEAILKDINKQVESGYMSKDIEKGKYIINENIQDINYFNYQIFKAGGSINKDSLKSTLEKNIKNYDAERQFKYLIKRLDELTSNGYVKLKDNGYSLTEKGIEERNNILVPQRTILKKYLSYLEDINLINKQGGNYIATESYNNYINNDSKESSIINKNISNILDKTMNNIDVGKLERTNLRIARGKYINNEYKEIETDYNSLREQFTVTDITEKTLKNMSTCLAVSGISREDANNIISNWNTISNSNINNDKIVDIINKEYDIIENNNKWGITTIISTKDWKEMFENLNVNSDDIPKWIFKGVDWKEYSKSQFYSNQIYTLVNDLWKSIWRNLEVQRIQSKSQAEYLKKNMVKQTNRSKSAIKEEIKKSKTNSLYKDDELEIE